MCDVNGVCLNQYFQDKTAAIGFVAYDSRPNMDYDFLWVSYPGNLVILKILVQTRKRIPHEHLYILIPNLDPKLTGITIDS